MNFNRKLILASKSPRRQQLLKDTGFNFIIKTKEVEEVYPADLLPSLVAEFLANKKARALFDEINDEILIAADTIVKVDENILGKPNNYNEAMGMLKNLSGRDHEVITGVFIGNKNKSMSFSETTKVCFKHLTKEEIDLYIKNFKPFDKAGAYGIQELLPGDVNFCSHSEKEFLQSTGNTSLYEKTKGPAITDQLIAIKSIEGSFFNVVGLPIHSVYDRLMHSFL